MILIILHQMIIVHRNMCFAISIIITLRLWHQYFMVKYQDVFAKKSKEDSSLVTIRKVTKALQSVNSKFFSLKVYVLLLFALSFFILFN